MRRRGTERRMRAGPILFFLLYFIIGGIVGMAINNCYYAIERSETSPSAKQ